MQSLAQGSSMAAIDASARTADTSECKWGLWSQPPEPTLPSPPRLPSPSPMLNNHGRALRQFLALVRRLHSRGPGLTFSSERSHGRNLRMERWWKEVAIQLGRNKPAARAARGGWGTTRDLKAGPSSTTTLPIRSEWARKSGSNHIVQQWGPVLGPRRKPHWAETERS